MIVKLRMVQNVVWYHHDGHAQRSLWAVMQCYACAAAIEGYRHPAWQLCVIIFKCTIMNQKGFILFDRVRGHHHSMCHPLKPEAADGIVGGSKLGRLRCVDTPKLTCFFAESHGRMPLQQGAQRYHVGPLWSSLYPR